MKKSYLISHNLEKYTVNEIMNEYLTDESLTYEFGSNDSRQMAVEDECYIYFSGIPNKSASRIMILGEVAYKDNNILTIVPKKMVNSLELTGEKLINIKGRKIDFREKQLLPDACQKLVKDVFEAGETFDINLLMEYIDVDLTDDYLYHEIKPTVISEEQIKKLNDRKPKIVNTSNTNSRSYYKNSTIKDCVLNRANFKCEIDQDHVSFITKYGDNYLEAHHLVPMEYQKDYSVNIDNSDNVICLCPNCHKKIHYGKENKTMIKNLYDKVKDRNFFKENNILLEQLFKYYK